MENIEILAPAGGMPQLVAAVRSGADAVYVGLKKFSARASAANFDEDELCEAVRYCHEYGVKLHVTLNILVYEKEYDELFDAIRHICSSGADAVIVQDLAVAKYIKSACPNMALHASTQMAIHNAEGARKAYELGFSRVVLARELSLEEIRKIRQDTPKELELEAFIHGALCMGASGRCELSAMLGGRSGNRGQCAQPCRLDFSCGNMKNCLSLKDMSHISAINSLYEAGVCSVKIEGRMKRPEYVAAAVDACVKARDGEKSDLDLLKSIFSRSGFTNGYLVGKRDRDMFGIRTKEDIQSSKGALSRASELYRRERQRVSVFARLELSERCARLMLSDGERSVSASLDGEFQINSEKALTKESAENFLSRLGGTPYILSDLTLENPDGVSVGASTLNALRRECAEKLSVLRKESVKHSFCVPIPEKRERQKRIANDIYIRSDSFEKVSHIADKAQKIILPIDEAVKCSEMLGDTSKIVAEMPSLIYDFSKYDEKLEKLSKMGINTLLCDNIGSISYAREKGFDVLGGFGLNITNSDSLEAYAKMGVCESLVSPEMPLGALSEMSGKARIGVFAYGYLPLMLFRACPIRAAIGCERCGGGSEITDRYGIKFKVVCHDRIYSELLNNVPHYIGDSKIPADFSLLYFTVENREEVERVYNSFIRGEKISKRTRGLYI